MVRVDVEYCGSCGHKDMYKEMKAVILKRVPETKVTGQPGRQKALQTELGKEMPSFEVEIENQLVYSKLKTMAFPDFEEVADVVEEVAMGGLVRPIKKQQPINCCIQ